MRMRIHTCIHSLMVILILIGFILPDSLSQNKAQSNDQLNPDSESTLIYAQVSNKKTGRFVAGLRRGDFSIYQGGGKQDIAEFSQEDLPVSIVLLLDVSGSMRYDVNLIRDVAAESLRQLKAEDEVSLMTFTENPGVILQFTRDKNLVKERIGALNRKDIHGPTYEREGLYMAAAHLKTASNPAGRRFIMVVTDNVSRNYIQPHSQKDVVKELFTSGAVIHGLIVPRSEPLLRDDLGRAGSINTYVEETGGVLLDIGDKEARNKLGTLMDKLHKRYVLRYKPSNLKPGDRRGEIKLKISPEAEKREGKLQVSFKVAP